MGLRPLQVWYSVTRASIFGATFLKPVPPITSTSDPSMSSFMKSTWSMLSVEQRVEAGYRYVLCRTGPVVDGFGEGVHGDVLVVVELLGAVLYTYGEFERSHVLQMVELDHVVERL